MEEGVRPVCHTCRFCHLCEQTVPNGLSVKLQTLEGRDSHHWLTSVSHFNINVIIGSLITFMNEHDPHWTLSQSSSRVQHYSVQSHCRQLPGRYGDFSAAFIHRDKFSFSWAHKRLFSWLWKAGIHSAIGGNEQPPTTIFPLARHSWQCLVSESPQQSTPWKPCAPSITTGMSACYTQPSTKLSIFP